MVVMVLGGCRRIQVDDFEWLRMVSDSFGLFQIVLGGLLF